jgi:stage V sporulation protein D (sporulation-specific penicillin-binding protein)
MPGEAEGMLAAGKYWKPINLATISYGQGISVTPIQMVQAYGAIANEGVMMRPRIVRKIADQDGRNVNVITPKVAGRPLKAKTAHEVLKILQGVCENGTGKNALVKGYAVGGKTGTANMVVNGMYASDKYIASFVGGAPIEDPRYVMLAKVDEPKGVIWGGTVAAPLHNKIGSQILWRLGVQPKDDGKAADLTPPAPEKEEKEAE